MLTDKVDSDTMFVLGKIKNRNGRVLKWKN